MVNLVSFVNHVNLIGLIGLIGPIQPHPPIAVSMPAQFDLNQLRPHAPLDRWRPGMRRAGVAMLLSGAEQPELLLIRRACHPNDPWSGQIALPGGNLDPGDPDTLGTACRETAEELGIPLDRDHCIGQLDDQCPQRSAAICVSCWVFRQTDPPLPRPNAEVADAFWLPLTVLAEPQRRILYHPPGYPEAVPALPLPPPADPDPPLWGLTYRFVLQLLERAEVSPPS